MQHLPVLPILIPFFGAVLILLPIFNERIGAQRLLAQLFLLATLVVSIFLFTRAIHGDSVFYALGDWQAPFGIVLKNDPLSAFMLVLTSVLALCAHLYACTGDDEKGRFFHPLFLFQVMGLSGTFLTADAFNLFVFFEILLIASYSLLIHGGGKERTRAAQHYVLYNLIGSAFFLIALAVLYRAFGTLNFADMAEKSAYLSSESLPLAQVGGGLLLVVFGIKAALLPMHFWLPRTYSQTSIPVAALFAVMTKVGIYSMWRVHTVIFGTGPLDGLGMDVLSWLAGGTVFAGAVGVLASTSLRWLITYLIIISVGTLLLTVAMDTPKATAAGIYYTLHSTLLSGAFFLVSGLIILQRGQAGDRLVSSRPMASSLVLGILFSVTAMSLVGLPPFSGFMGKVFILQAAVESGDALWVWPLVLLSGLAAMIALSRAGTTLFWRTQGSANSGLDTRMLAPQLISTLLLVVASPLLVVFAGPLSEWSLRAANDLHAGIVFVSMIGEQP